MNVLVPLLSGKENSDEFIDVFSKGAGKIILLQVIDRAYLNQTSTAMGEIMQFSSLMSDLKKRVGKKKKKCEDITEWGSANKKILAIAIIQKVDKIFLVEQDNKFFSDLLSDLKKNKLSFEVVKILSVEDKK